jgi:hypothetical protein
MRLVLVCGPWGSGTTAVAGLLHRVGLKGFGPYFQTSDERTRNSYELLPFRELMLQLASEEKLSLQPNAAAVLEQRIIEFRERIRNQELGPYAEGDLIYLKHPLTALMLPQLCRVFDTKLIYVLRSLEQIEATRRRRNWPAHFGLRGARAIYGNMFTVLINHEFPTYVHVLRYTDLLNDPTYQVAGLMDFTGRSCDAATIREATAFLRPP